MKDLFSIGELAKLQNISRQTFIFYDKIGLFCPAYIDPENGYRYYNINQLDTLDAICIMKRIGFSLNEIKENMKSFTSDRSIVALRKQLSSLNEIKENMKSFTSDRSIVALRKQLSSINQQIEELELIKSRVEHRLNQIERSMDIFDRGDHVLVGDVDSQSILIQEVPAPYTLEMVSIVTKECFVRAAKEHLPIFFQSGVIVPYQNILIQDVPAPYTLEMVSIVTKECFVRAAKEHLPIFFQSGVIVPYQNILQGIYTEASHAFLSIEKSDHIDGVIELPQGRCFYTYHTGDYLSIGTSYQRILDYCQTHHLTIISNSYEFAMKGRCVYTYHTGDYLSIGTSYQRILDYCQTHHLTIISNSYEFAMNDYLSTANENEYITKIMFYIQDEH